MTKSKILLVEDNELVCMMLSRALESAGYTADIRHSGESALQILEEKNDTPYDLIITDNAMPGMGGKAFVETAKARGMNALILAISDTPPCDTDIADCLLPKPFHKTEFLNCVFDLLRSSKP